MLGGQALYGFMSDGLYYNISSSSSGEYVIVTSPSSGKYKGDIIIPSTVTYSGKTYPVRSIGISAFSGCTELTSVSIPSSVLYISQHVFSGCTGLTSIYVPNSVVSIGYMAFNKVKNVVYNGSATNDKPWGALTINGVFDGDFIYADAEKTQLSVYIGNGGDVVIPEGVTDIGYYAFNGANKLTTLTIPSSVTNIGNRVFEGCTGHLIVNCNIGSVSASSNGWFYNSKFNHIEIGNDVTTIGDYAFSDNSNISSLTIGNNVKTIGIYAFTSTPVKTVWLPNTPPSYYARAKGKINYVSNANYSELGEVQIYSYLSSMFEVDGIKYVLISPSERACDAIDIGTIGEDSILIINKQVAYRGITLSVKKINPYFAYNEKEIKYLTISDGIMSMPDYAFYGCSSIQSINLGSSLTSLGIYAFSECNSLKQIKIPDNVSEIGKYAFSGCKKMEKANLGNGVTTIGTYIFQNCSTMNSIVISSNLQTIPRYAFTGCSSLKSICIPQSVSLINDYAFSGCTNLTNLIIENRTSTLTLGNNGTSPLFVDCQFDSVYIGGKISYNTSPDYSYSPFYSNTFLRKVVIADKETEIYDNEFYGCTNLTSVSIGDGVKSIGKYAFSGCSSLESFVFGSGMKSIGQEAFSDCSALTSLYSEAATPPTCGTQALEDINKWECTLYVPSENIVQYQTANQWQDFFFVDANPYTSEPITQLSITDGDALVIPTSTNYATVNYSRTFSSADKWQAFYVPFSIPVETLAENGLEVAELNNIHMYDTDEDGEFDKTTLEFLYLKRGATEPNYPYLIKSASAGDVTLTMTDVEVKATEETEIECSTTRVVFKIRGTYAGVSGAVMYANNYYAMGGGTLVRMANADSGLKPQRWYLAVENKDGSLAESLAATMRISIDGIEIEESETAIGEVNAIGQKQDEVYMLDGRKLNGTDALKSGLYVKNHKKLFVR